jgi:Family of unknown function (DUF6027)
MSDLSVELLRWDGPWSQDDPDANFKADVALYSRLDPLTTITSLSDNLGIPVGALARYVLARWASAGAESLLFVGPSVVTRMWEQFESAETMGTDDARLASYKVLRQMVAWLKSPLET